MYHTARYLIVIGALSAAAPLAWAQDELVLGHISSLSNPAAVDNARDISNGYRVYFDRVNAAGGVHGRRLRLLHRDDNLNATAMVEITHELIADPSVIALVGYLNTAGLTEIVKQDLLGRSGIALIAPSQGNPNIVSGENVFPFRSGYTDEMKALMRECLNTQKKRVAIVYMNVAFGPPSAKFAEQAARDAGLDVTTTFGYETAPPKIAESIKQAITTVAKTPSDAIILLAAGRGAFEFIKGMHETLVEGERFMQIYGLSVLQTNDVVNLAGIDAAHGVIISQSVPYPYSGTLPITREFLKAMRESAPRDPINFFSLEGYIGAKITVEALKRAGPNPTRKRVVEALKSMGEFDLGGVYVNYSRRARTGWQGVDMTII